VTYPIGKPRARISYFNPITIESGPTSGPTRVFENPTSRIGKDRKEKLSASKSRDDF
jgi:hypothetical protein